MNFLAHLKLSGDHEYIMLGNFIADHIRGNKISHLPQEVIDGIMLHRKIDFYTDHHPEFMKTRARLHKKYHKYAGVIADVYYDHFLAKNWNDYSEYHLSSFTTYSYGILLRHYSLLPSQTKKILPFFIMQNWLTSYKKFEGLRRSFQYLAKRANFKSNMEFAVEDLIDDYELYEAEFRAFFPDVATYCQNELDKLFPADRMSKKNQIINEKAINYKNRSVKEEKHEVMSNDSYGEKQTTEYNSKKSFRQRFSRTKSLKKIDEIIEKEEKNIKMPTKNSIKNHVVIVEKSE
ncbi:MAG: DUF479 domain-containing protein [Bacteroidales bacterium]|nr:DUF479 domain-containing protein [Bacteroidales bacterium]